MSAYVFELATKFVTITCYKCRMVFAVSNHVDDKWRESGDSFFCPNGHSQHYTESDIRRLEKQLAHEKKQRELAEKRAQWARNGERKAEYQRRAYKGQLTKMRKRVANGVCPRCNRSFANVRQHMKTQHPEMLQELDANA